VAFLNEALALDSDFVQALVTHRPHCNQALADHPTIPVGKAEKGGFRTGFIGVLNGYLSSQEEAMLAGNFDENGRIIEFIRI
jgi:hypothetical protein